MSTPKKIYQPRICALASCGVEFIPTRGWQIYHTPECRKAAGKEKRTVVCPRCGMVIGGK
jgi:hypothetical protein